MTMNFPEGAHMPKEPFSFQLCPSFSTSVESPVEDYRSLASSLVDDSPQAEPDYVSPRRVAWSKRADHSSNLSATPAEGSVWPEVVRGGRACRSCP